jgi:hypothetical protein
VANQAVALELSRKSRRGNVAHGIGNYWLCYLDVGRWTLFEFVMNVNLFKDRNLGEDFEKRNRKIRTTTYLAEPSRYLDKRLLERLKIDIAPAKVKIYLRVLIKTVI